LVHVTGLSHPGRYTRDVVAPHWDKLGTASLPDAKPVSAERLVSGVEDGWRVEVTALVNSEKADKGRLVLNLASGDARFQAFVPLSTNADQMSHVGAMVRVRGTAGTYFDTRLKRVSSVKIYAPQTSDLTVDQVLKYEVLTNAAAVLSLPPNRAMRPNTVLLTGVVTAAEPDWGGNFFVQDPTGGAFVNNEVCPQPSVGDLVQLRGVSHLGAYAPDIMLAQWNKLGTSPLPEPAIVSVDEFMSGAEDGNRVEVSGVIRSVQQPQTASKRMTMQIVSGGFRFLACCPVLPNVDPNTLVGATVRVRGTAAASFNALERRILTIVLFIPQDSDVSVEHLTDNAVMQEPFTSMNGIAQYHRDSSSDPRIRVKGVVTYQRPGMDIFLHDGSGGLQVECADTNVHAPGEIVEAVGFPALERYFPVLQDATLIRENESGLPVVPVKVAISKLLEGCDHADLISLQGVLMDCSSRPLLTARSLSNSPAETVLTLQNGNYFFSVQSPAGGQFAKLAFIPIGSTLTVTGVCLLQANESGKTEAVRVLLPNATSLRILKQPNWWTPKRLLIGLGVLMATLFVGITWTIMILRKNSALKSSIAERIQAQSDLQKAHDLLETRVEERTKQLKFEMGARQKAEVQFKAVLAERTRLAQELHDTLLQGFTGIGLKLDAFAQSLPASLAGAREKLQHVLEQSDQYLAEARRTIWELRSPSLEKYPDFSAALLHACNRSLQGTDIQLDFSVAGEARRIPPAVEENLLRICEEAVTNAVKHGRPKQTQVYLKFAPRELQLRIQDDGCGFDPNGPDGSKTGHFGLVGIRERVDSLNGCLTLSSQVGKGTEVLVTLAA
jgi:signal transduction histidine kinase